MTEPESLHPIEQRILERAYSSPSTARAGVARSALKAREKARLRTLIEAWEGQSAPDVIGGAAPVEVPTLNGHTRRKGKRKNGSNGASNGAHANGAGREVILRHIPLPLVLSLNARIRAKLTVYGVTRLHAARDRITVPEGFLDAGSVWETTLWEFIGVMGPEMMTGAMENPTRGGDIELLTLG